MKKLLALTSLPLLLSCTGMIILCVTASCSDDGPEAPRLYNEQDSIAICAIMTEGPQVQAFGLQWREGEIHRLPEGFEVTWEPGADGQLRVTELELTLLDKYDYTDGQLSDAISLMTELRKLDIHGWQWVGKMPESMSELNSLCDLTIERTNFESLPAIQWPYFDYSYFNADGNRLDVVLPSVLPAGSPSIEQYKTLFGNQQPGYGVTVVAPGGVPVE